MDGLALDVDLAGQAAQAPGAFPGAFVSRLPGQFRPDDLAQTVEVQRLGHQFDGPVPGRLREHLRVPHPGYHDRGNVAYVVAERVYHVQTGTVAQHQVGDHQVGTVPARHIDGLVPAAGRLDAQILAAQRVGKQLPYRRLIVHHQDSRLFLSGHFALSRLSGPRVLPPRPRQLHVNGCSFADPRPDPHPAAVVDHVSPGPRQAEPAAPACFLV